ncbi:MAG TPA: hypothetical protein VGQ18_11770 [Gemmatimonadales bacterium]|jgi:hypothetical protein|nr:hypothetical protein [Gemmatimonadales bacterium]
MNQVVLASVCIIAAFPHAATAQQPSQPTHNVQGAVRLVDVRARALEVTTGVGMALRVVRLQVPADVRVTAAGAALTLGQLAPGDIVRVSYGGQPGGYRAYTIERVGRMETGPEGAP